MIEHLAGVADFIHPSVRCDEINGRLGDHELTHIGLALQIRVIPNGAPVGLARFLKVILSRIRVGMKGRRYVIPSECTVRMIRYKDAVLISPLPTDDAQTLVLIKQDESALFMPSIGAGM
jgi:hypothetical protein